MKPPSDKKREKVRAQMNKLRSKTEESSATISDPKFIPKDEWRMRILVGESQKSGRS